MIQFNLLPDVKIQYIKTKRLKRFMVMSAFAASGVSLLILFMTVSYAASRGVHLGNLEDDIEKEVNTLNETPDLTRILSVQNQLNALNTKYNEDGTVAERGLYDNRPAVERLSDYLARTTPTSIKGFGAVTLDMANASIETAGTAETLEQVNEYVDTLKFTSYTTEEEGSQPKLAFSNVVLSSYSRDSVETAFTVTFNFDPIIFDIMRKIQIRVPDQVTTHADQSSVIFDGSGLNQGEGEQ